MLKRFQTFLRAQNNADVLKRQKLLLMIVAGLGLTLVYFFIFGGEEPQPSSFKKKEIKKVDIQSGGKRVDPQEVWKYKIEEEGQGLKKDLSELRSMISDQLSASDLKLNEENTFLKEKIQSLEDKFEAAELQKKMGGAIGSHHSVNPSGNQPRDQARDQQGFNSNGFHPFHQNGFEGEESFGSSTLYGGIQKISLALGGNSSKEQIKTVDNTIPAGSFAKAVLLVGVDASTAMNASSDPRPMLLRIVDFGSLPRRFKSDLKDCRCTASAYGDISSERVYVRLEKLTCVERETGEIIETQVAGHVAGSDGRVGIRGKVVSKDAAYLGRGLMSGVLGGLSSIASPSKTSNMTPNGTIILGTSTVEAQSRGELFSSGVASGSAQALDRLSNYYIDRAEQLQPVIQVSAGQFADVIFTEGVSVGDTNVKREISKVRDAARLKAAERLGQSADSRGLGFHQRSNH